jgi:hypothetical protein
MDGAPAGLARPRSWHRTRSKGQADQAHSVTCVHTDVPSPLKASTTRQRRSALCAGRIPMRSSNSGPKVGALLAFGRGGNDNRAEPRQTRPLTEERAARADSQAAGPVPAPHRPQGDGAGMVRWVRRFTAGPGSCPPPTGGVRRAAPNSPRPTRTLLPSASAAGRRHGGGGEPDVVRHRAQGEDHERPRARAGGRRESSRVWSAVCRAAKRETASTTVWSGSTP